MHAVNQSIFVCIMGLRLENGFKRTYDEHFARSLFGRGINVIILWNKYSINQKQTVYSL